MQTAVLTSTYVKGLSNKHNHNLSKYKDIFIVITSVKK